METGHDKIKEILDKYKEEIDDLISTCYCAVQQIQLPHKQKYQKHLVALYSSIEQLEPNRQNVWVITRDEIEGALMYMWVVFIGRYYTSRPKVALRTYLLRRSIWGLRDWVKRQWLVVQYMPQEPTPEDPKALFELDLKFLMFGTPIYPMSELTAYERYLVFLHFTEEKTILEIAQTVHKTRKTVGKHLSKTLNKMRRLAHDSPSEDTR